MTVAILVLLVILIALVVADLVVTLRDRQAPEPPAPVPIYLTVTTPPPIIGAEPDHLAPPLPADKLVQVDPQTFSNETEVTAIPPQGLDARGTGSFTSPRMRV